MAAYTVSNDFGGAGLGQPGNSAIAVRSSAPSKSPNNEGQRHALPSERDGVSLAAVVTLQSTQINHGKIVTSPAPTRNPVCGTQRQSTAFPRYVS